LQALAPEKIAVPSGSLIHIQYSGQGEAPVLAVRLQEVFGWLDTPKINEGKIPLLLHLLSPGFKPVQVTSDLRSFWMNTYFEVKKELKRRYPKHSWPDEPLQAEAVRGVKRK
jgi:ATP-dependent helicase HrpB